MKKYLALALLCLFAAGCINNADRILDNGSASQLAMRNYQSRSFDTPDKARVLRNVIATMQDLGFIVDNADKDLGTVSGSSFASNATLTVSVRMRGNQAIVRANAERNMKQITDPEPYRNFFNALSQSLFLTGNEVL